MSRSSGKVLRLCYNVAQWHIRAFEPMERSDYLPSQILQELAKQVDPRVELDREAERVSAASHTILPWHQRRKAHASRLANACYWYQVMQDIADDFVENVAAFACELAVHRGGTTLEAKDIQLALGTHGSGSLGAGVCAASCTPTRPHRSRAKAATHPPLLCVFTEKNWNMRLVGVGDHTGELKVIRKTNATEVHKSRLQEVRRSKSIAHR